MWTPFTALLRSRNSEQLRRILYRYYIAAHPSRRTIPFTMKQASKQAAMGAAAAGTKAAKHAASATTRAATDAGRRATNKAWDAVPKIGSYATWTGRRVAYLLFGTAFVYGVGSSLPGAVARYYTDKDRRRDEEERRRAEGAGDFDVRPSGGGDSLSSTRAEDAGSALRELSLVGLVERWLEKP